MSPTAKAAKAAFDDAIGETLTVMDVWPARDGSRRGSSADITFSDGTIVSWR
jgi:hypothetical protein